MIEQLRGLAKELPDLTRCGIVATPDDPAASLLNIVVRPTRALDSPAGRRKVRGAYVPADLHHPYANFYIDYPAIDHRIVFWQLWARGVTFFLHRQSNRWKQSNGIEERWPEGAWVTAGRGNGAACLLYPGKEAVLPSIRLAHIRDGIEDYEALAVLAKWNDKLDPAKHAALIAENKTMLAVPDAVSAGMANYADDPAVLLAARRKVDEQILETKKALAR